MTTHDSSGSTGGESINTSDDGTRPSTSGGVDNMGGADSFTPSQTPDGRNSAPGPDEKMKAKRQGGDEAASATHPGPRNTD